MTSVLRIARSIVLVALVGALLGATLPCDVVCAALGRGHAAGVDDAHVAADSHCAKSASAKTAGEPAAPPCEDDCPGCGTSRVSIPSSADGASGALAKGLVAVAPPGAHPVRSTASAGEPLRIRHAADPPPRDVLALTTTLLI